MVRPRLLGLALASALVLAGCSGGGEADEPAEEPSESSSSPAVVDDSYLPVPEGVELTAQGSELAVGDTATVAYEPRQEQVAALDLTVTKLEKASFKLFVGWRLPDSTLETAPYFISVKVENVGETDLGGKRVPLYAVDGDNKLIESSTFASTFEPCPSASFPRSFTTGDTFKTCLVYLAPDKGDLVAASFRPSEEFNPITWTGEVTKATAGGDKGKGKGDRKGKKGGGKSGGGRGEKGQGGKQG